MNSDKFDAILLTLIKSDNYRVLVDNVAAQVSILNGRVVADVFEPVGKIYDLSNVTKFSVIKGYIQCCLSNGEWHELELMKSIDPNELLA